MGSFGFNFDYGTKATVTNVSVRVTILTDIKRPGLEHSGRGLVMRFIWKELLSVT